MRDTALERVVKEYELEVISTAPSYCMCMLSNCNTHCEHIENSTKEEPCYGQVMIELEIEPGDYIHTCRGHQWIWNNALYKHYAPKESQ
jgi:hypothetical protein